MNSVLKLLLVLMFAHPSQPAPYQAPRLQHSIIYHNLLCWDAQNPIPISTPEPLVDAGAKGLTVDFLIGTDGRVHSAFILKPGRPAPTKSVRQMVSTLYTWQFHPARCGGSALGYSEAIVEFDVETPAADGRSPDRPTKAPRP